MAKLRSVNTHFWDDGFVINLDPIEKLLFLYFLTNPLANIAGAYEINIRRIAFDTGVDKDMILKILSRFEAAGKIIYRDDWIFITNFIKNQSLNPKIITGIEISAKHCPDWVKHSLSIAYPSLSIDYDNLNLNSNSNSNSKAGSKSADVILENERDAAEVNPDLKTDFSSYYKSVAAALSTNLLPNEHRWLKVFEQSETEKIPPEALTDSLKILLSQKRDYPVTPENAFNHAIEKRAKNSLDTGFIAMGEPRKGLLSDVLKPFPRQERRV